MVYSQVKRVFILEHDFALIFRADRETFVKENAEKKVSTGKKFRDTGSVYVYSRKRWTSAVMLFCLVFLIQSN